MDGNLSVALQTAILALQLAVLLFAARVAGNLARKLRLPAVLGELLAGILIGPYILGKLSLPLHGLENGLFPLIEAGGSPVSLPLYSLAVLGSIILLFISGLETNLRQFFRYSLAGTLIGIGGVIFSFAFGAGLGMIMLKTALMDPRCLFLGILSTATSVGITARILSERKSIDSPEGTTIMAAAVIDDVLGIICLAIVMGITGVSTQGGSIDWGNIGMIAVKSFGIWLGVTAAGLALAHKTAAFLKLFGSSKVFSILSFGLALLLAGLFEQAGLAMIVGAYVTGLCLSKTDIAFSIQRHLESIYAFLVPVFFVVMGMMVDIRVFADGGVLTFGLIYSALAIAAKIIGCALPAYMMNFNSTGALRIGMGMIPRGEVALIIAGIGSTTMMQLNGKTVPIINAELFGVCIIMTLLTTIVAPPLLSLTLNIKRKGVRKEILDKDLIHTVYEFKSEHIRDFVIRIMQENFRRDGFRHSNMDHTGGIVSFRRAKVVFSLTVENNVLDFESDANEAILIKTIMHETFVEIQQTMAELKDLEPPEGLKNIIRTGGKTAADKNPELKIDRIIPPSAVIVNLHSESYFDAINEIIAKLANSHLLKDADLCARDVFKREEVFSTCIPGGIALPHARTAGVSRLISAIAVSKNGIPSGDGREKMKIFVLTLSSPETDQPYLQYIARIGRLLIKEKNIKQILQASSPAELRTIFVDQN